ncbi:MAG: HAD-IIA family hydrolase [Actinomycetota bacterium]|jgi:4-nitrophenyl phosphatase|nr:HAD-IIA family hydrolase [Actinomycetota bacterium]
MRARSLRGVVFDLDGCLVKGQRAIPGAAEVVALLRERSVTVRYFTNDSSKTPAETARRLSQAGISAHPREVLTSAIVAAGYASRAHPGGRVLAVGGPALRSALEEAGLCLVDDESAEVVVVGRDPEFSYAKLEVACRAVWGGAVFIATNRDRRVPVSDGFVPGTGAIVSAIAWATNRRPKVTGKPSVLAARAAVEALGLDADQVVVVGDGLDQDVRMGKAVGARAVLVLSGASRREDAEHAPARYRPDAVLADVTGLPEWMERQREPIATRASSKRAS